jgi:hypothetical protein
MHNALALELDIGRLRLIRILIVADCKAFQIHDDLGYVLLDTRNRAELMENAVNLHLADCRARKGGKHDSSEGIPQGDTIASLQRFYDKTAIPLVGRQLLDRNLRFVKIEHL